MDENRVNKLENDLKNMNLPKKEFSQIVKFVSNLYDKNSSEGVTKDEAVSMLGKSSYKLLLISNVLLEANGICCLHDNYKLYLS